MKKVKSTLLLALTGLALSSLTATAGNDPSSISSISSISSVSQPDPSGKPGGSVPDAGATLLLAAMGFGALALAKKTAKK